jgi:hypothetical protein
MRRSALTAAFLLAAAGLPAVASAQNPSCGSVAGNLVTNCSFEDPGLGSGTWQWTNNITGWTSSSGWFERWYGEAGFASRDGRAHLELDVDTQQSAGGQMNTTIWQVLNTQAGRTYDVFFSAAHRTKSGGDGAFSEVGAFVDGTGSATPTFGSALFTSGKVYNANSFQWTDYGFSFVATGAQTTLGFRALGTANEYGDHLDNIGVTARVPEPGTALLVASGLLGLGVMARRRRA